ncbi:hypothetical protein [Mameliella alba]|uniref:Amidase n=1 Tax=Mameliella alba TaxID=561184 RepID=A0A0B3SKQ3_9RHOB|nr:hypothetical protein [Mameliella alba]KHQ51134.1 hypothetical protein OA50_04505 [Mameliella alba]
MKKTTGVERAEKRLKEKRARNAEQDADWKSRGINPEKMTRQRRRRADREEAKSIASDARKTKKKERTIA